MIRFYYLLKEGLSEAALQEAVGQTVENPDKCFKATMNRPPGLLAIYDKQHHFGKIRVIAEGRHDPVKGLWLEVVDFYKIQPLCQEGCCVDEPET